MSVAVETLVRLMQEQPELADAVSAVFARGRGESEVVGVSDSGGEVVGGSVERVVGEEEDGVRSGVHGVVGNYALGGVRKKQVSRSSDTSWADVCRSSASSDGSSVEMPVGGVKADLSKISFYAEDACSSASFYRKFVKTNSVKNFEEWLCVRGVPRFRSKLYSLALVTYTPATMPVEFADGKKKLKSYAVVGDKIASALLSYQMHKGGWTSEEMSVKTNRVLSRKSMTAVSVGSGHSDFLLFPANVDRAEAATADECLEALIGVVFDIHGLKVVESLLVSLQLL